MNQKPTLVLETGLFEDTDTLRGALRYLDGVSIIRLQPDTMDTSDWDRVITKILAADRVIAI
ncbi:MAG TPA: hypothetical protein ENI62_09575 [Gammaproteobacteria bacterium]|nr:hypothetical protein [Gammaproteobacteria bacterium]